jgi:hypothetical protein
MIPDVVVYLSSLQKQVPSRKVEVLEAFAEGARHQGAQVTIQRKYELVPAKLAVMLGWASPQQAGPNIKLRANLIAYQNRTNNHLLAIDASTFKFHDENGKYLRYSLNGVFYDTSNYANKGSDARKWVAISNDLGLTMSPWRNAGDYILLLMQRDGGWSMKGLDPIMWVRQKVSAVRNFTDLPILVRPHPGKKIDLSPLKHLNVQISDSRSRTLSEDLSQAKGACVFNSSSGVAAILQGVPLMVDDSSSVCWDVANHDMRGLVNPNFTDRHQWIWDLAAAHWSDEESRQGLVFNKFLPYIS